jgi:hypothetical protein
MRQINLLSGIRPAVKSLLHLTGLPKAGQDIRDLHCVKRLQRVSQQHQFVVSANGAGLGKRIKCLASSMRLADKLSRTIALNWTLNSHCCCSFSDLFENRFLELRDYELNVIVNRAHMFEYDQWHMVGTWRLLTLPNDVPGNFSRAYRSSTLGKNIDFEYDRIPGAVCNEYARYFATLLPTGFINKEVEQFATQFDNNTISASIRSWADDKDRSESLFRLENIYRVLDNEEQSSVFVSCDSEEVLRHVVRRYGRRVISYPHSAKVGDRLTRRGMQEALIDLLLLSKNDRLKVSAYSCFSEAAWWLGGCRASVECFERDVPEWDEDSASRAYYDQTMAFYERHWRPETHSSHDTAETG